MAILDEQVKEIVGDVQYYHLIARMTLKELKEYRYHDEYGKEKKLTQKEVLARINILRQQQNQEIQEEIQEGNPIFTLKLLSLSWVKKWWNN